MTHSAHHEFSPKDLHRHAAEHHELAAQHHRVAGMCQDCCHDDDADHHAHEASHHTFHAAMHLVDPKSLPETTGLVTKFLFNFDNEANGLLLDSEHQVHFPAYMSERLLKKIKIGESIAIHGLKRRGSDILVAISITSANGTEMVDSPPKEKH